MKQKKKPETREERAATFRAPKSATTPKYVTRTYTYKDGTKCTVTAPYFGDNKPLS